MEHPDDIKPDTFRVHPGGSRLLTRKKKLLAAIALTAVAGLAGLAEVGMASAADSGMPLGYVTVGVSFNDWNSSKAGWGKAWDQCRREYPSTSSVQMVNHLYNGGDRDPAPRGPYQLWSCDGTATDQGPNPVMPEPPQVTPSVQSTGS